VSCAKRCFEFDGKKFRDLQPHPIQYLLDSGLQSRLLSLTASWLWRITYQPCVGHASGWQLRQLRLVRSSITSDTAKTLVHAFVSSLSDYCNSLLYGVSDGLLRKLQTLQNAAALVVTGTRKFNHITPVLRELHWLPVRQRIKYKLAMIVYKCLHGLSPIYLVDDCHQGRRSLWDRGDMSPQYLWRGTSMVMSLPPNILDVMSFRMSTQVTATVVCFILT